MDCQCEHCQSACLKRPGWFKHGEAEKAAEVLGLTLQEFFDKYLVADFHYRDTSAGEVPVWLLAPGIKSEPTGQEASFNPRGECVFFQDGKCSIHATKPSECAFYDHTVPDGVAMEHRDSVVMESWKKNQNQITELLGHEPVLPPPTLSGLFKMMFGFAGD